MQLRPRARNIKKKCAFPHPEIKRTEESAILLFKLSISTPRSTLALKRWIVTETSPFPAP